MNGLRRVILLFVLCLLGFCATVYSEECACSCSVIQQKDRSTILAVGSEAVYPFAAYICEYLGASTEYSMPMVVKMETARGIELFTENSNIDIVHASRRITSDEYNHIQKYGVGELLELGFGYDGIVFARRKSGKKFAFSSEEIFLALAAEVPVDGRLVKNPYSKWSQINPSLPDVAIAVYGPDSGSGTLTTLENTLFRKVSKRYSEYNGIVPAIRSDEAYHVYYEDEAKIIHEIMNNNNAIGIINYSFLENGHEYLAGVSIDGVSPQRKAISSGEYLLSRKLFLYLKLAHLKRIPGLQRLVELFLSPKTLDKGGVFEGLGLITLSEDDYRQLVRSWIEKRALSEADL